MTSDPPMPKLPPSGPIGEVAWGELVPWLFALANRMHDHEPRYTLPWYFGNLIGSVCGMVFEVCISNRPEALHDLVQVVNEWAGRQPSGLPG